MAIMEIVEKEYDLNENKVVLRLFDTQYNEFARKIKDVDDKTLENITTNDFVSDSLLLDLKTKQDEIYDLYNNATTGIITLIKAYITSKGASMTAFPPSTFTYTSLTNIDADDILDNSLLSNIMSNESYLTECRQNTLTALYNLKKDNIDRIRLELPNISGYYTDPSDVLYSQSDYKRSKGYLIYRKYTTIGGNYLIVLYLDIWDLSETVTSVSKRTRYHLLEQINTTLEVEVEYIYIYMNDNILNFKLKITTEDGIQYIEETQEVTSAYKYLPEKEITLAIMQDRYPI